VAAGNALDAGSFPTLRLTTESEGQVVVLTFDHGRVNEMGSQQLRELEALVEWLHQCRSVRAMITRSTRHTSKGTAIFVAGANVTERAAWSDAEVKSHVRWQRQVLARLAQVPIFHVAVVSGHALGWGTEYLLTADYRIATEKAVFALPETGLGILPGAGGTSELWAHIGVAHTLRLGITGERIVADEAARIGLVQEVVDEPDAALERARRMCAMVCRRSPTAVAAFKSAVLQALGKESAERAEAEARAYEHCVDTGEAGHGRAQFAAIRKGERVEWQDRVVFLPSTEED